MSNIDHVLWGVGGGGDFNPDGAIYKLWSAYREQGNYLGLPVTSEIDVGNSEVQQGFSSGAVIAWNSIDGARLV